MDCWFHHCCLEHYGEYVVQQSPALVSLAYDGFSPYHRLWRRLAYSDHGLSGFAPSYFQSTRFDGVRGLCRIDRWISGLFQAGLPQFRIFRGSNFCHRLPHFIGLYFVTGPHPQFPGSKQIA